MLDMRGDGEHIKALGAPRVDEALRVVAIVIYGCGGHADAPRSHKGVRGDEQVLVISAFGKSQCVKDMSGKETPTECACEHAVLIYSVLYGLMRGEYGADSRLGIAGGVAQGVIVSAMSADSDVGIIAVCYVQQQCQRVRAEAVIGINKA